MRNSIQRLEYSGWSFDKARREAESCPSADWPNALPEHLPPAQPFRNHIPSSTPHRKHTRNSLVNLRFERRLFVVASAPVINSGATAIPRHRMMNLLARQHGTLFSDLIHLFISLFMALVRPRCQDEISLNKHPWNPCARPSRCLNLLVVIS